MKTYIASEKDWAQKTYLVDASGKTLGRLATRVASLLIGKGKPSLMTDKLCGDQVVVINAKGIHVTGRKSKQKIYKHYSGYPGGLKTYNFETLIEKKPEEVILRAVSRMLPKNKLGSEMLKRLRVYAGSEHQQQAQKPEPIELS
ncbi:MAG: 50S ribosomal protein L13 [Candidatus Omnitrophica bacterium]|nr:50S ribosomal protein L13 [Candidatus Omnitrophota bacterium]